MNHVQYAMPHQLTIAIISDRAVREVQIICGTCGAYAALTTKKDTSTALKNLLNAIIYKISFLGRMDGRNESYRERSSN